MSSVIQPVVRSVNPGQAMAEGNNAASQAMAAVTTTTTPQTEVRRSKVSQTTTVIASLTAGALAGATAKTVIAPLDRTKIYFQTHPDKSYRLKRALKYIHTTYKTEGFLFLWRGNSATMARIVPYAAFQFLAHDQYKRLLGIHTDQLKNGRKASKEEEQSRKIKHFFAGALAGMTGQTLTYPLDRARAVMAVAQIGEYKNLLDVFKRTVRNEGVLSLYRGFVPTILGVIPYAGTSFFTYEQLKAHWAAKSNNRDDPSPTFLQRLSFGALAGLLGQTASYPLDIVRRRMQTATQMGVNHNRYATIIGTLVYVFKKEGIRRGWYKGVSMNFIKGPIAVGISFTTYDYFNNYLKLCLASNYS